MVRCALPGQSHGGILRADPVCVMMLNYERTPSHWNPFNGSDALDASAKREIAIRRANFLGADSGK
jgi:hypothetical protein